MKEEGNNIFVNFSNDYTPSWLWCLHDLVLSHLLSETASDCRKKKQKMRLRRKGGRDKT